MPKIVSAFAGCPAIFPRPAALSVVMAANESAGPAQQLIATWVRDPARAVRGYVLGLVRRADIADDLVQEVFQRAWQSRDRYCDSGHERAFLLKIADRLVIDRSRRVGREINVDDAT